jgi:hypothetical protein
MEKLNIGDAVEALKANKRVFRLGWDAKRIWLAIHVDLPHPEMMLPYICLFYPEGHEVYPSGHRILWSPTQADILGNDWQVIE